MLDGIKGLREIKLQDNDWSFGSLALVDVLECPCEAILDRAPLDETILIHVNKLENDTLKMISKDFGD